MLRQFQSHISVPWEEKNIQKFLPLKKLIRARECLQALHTSEGNGKKRSTHQAVGGVENISINGRNGQTTSAKVCWCILFWLPGWVAMDERKKQVPQASSSCSVTMVSLCWRCLNFKLRWWSAREYAVRSILVGRESGLSQHKCDGVVYVNARAIPWVARWWSWHTELMSVAFLKSKMAASGNRKSGKYSQIPFNLGIFGIGETFKKRNLCPTPSWNPKWWLPATGKLV